MPKNSALTLEELTEFYRGEVKPEFDKLNRRFRNLENEVSFIKDDIGGIKAELSTTPTRSEFEHLKNQL